MTPHTELKYKIRQYYQKFQSFVKLSTDIIAFLTSFITLCLLIYEIGFHEDGKIHLFLLETYKIILRIFLYTGLARVLSDPQGVKKERGFWFEVVLLIALVFIIILEAWPAFKDVLVSKHFIEVATYLLLSTISVIEFSKQIVTTLQRYVKPEMMFVYSFLFIILVGTFLLLLPNAHTYHLDFIDAFFTSTSAVCITGLTVVDTSTAFTFTGLIILVSLIQIGGIGVMTFTSFFAMSFFSQVSFRDQLSLKNILNENSLSNIFRTLFYIILTTFLIEGFGAYVIYNQIQDIPQHILPDKLFFSIFHAVSSFCNAGFSTLPGNLYNPAVRNLYGFQSWIACLVILGGIGFPILFNFGKLFIHYFHNALSRLKGNPIAHYGQFHIISLTTRIVLPITLILIIGGTFAFLFLENHHILQDVPLSGKIALAFMNAVTPRTAGFNNVEMTSLLPSTLFLILLLMWIGASPMSTGGGIKTTTFVVAFKNIVSIIREKKTVEIARRTISPTSIRRANAIILLSLLWIGGATLLLLITNPQAPFLQALFEVVSALSTVGLSLGLTPELNISGKIIISITMFAGRVGILTLLTGMIRQQPTQPYQYPEENVIL